MSHQVFIERCRDAKPETASALARALASRYGVDPAQIESRLVKGRFQVKAGLDLQTARAFVSYLEGEGALCSIVDAAGQTVMRSVAVAETVMGMRDEVSMPAPDDHDEFALHTPPPPPDYGNDYESGLSAGFASQGSAQTLGALDDGSASAAYQLSTLDGQSEAAPAIASPTKVAAPDDQAAFLPPDMLREQELVLDVQRPAAKEVDPPAPVHAPSALAAAIDLAGSPPPPRTGPEAPLPSRALGAISRDERLRFAVGVALAIVLSFVAVHIFASGREADRYGEVKAELRAEYAAADTLAAWQRLEDARSHALDSLKSRRSNIVIMSLVLWLVLGALFLFVWLRLIDWRRWQAHGLHSSS